MRASERARVLFMALRWRLQHVCPLTDGMDMIPIEHCCMMGGFFSCTLAVEVKEFYPRATHTVPIAGWLQSTLEMRTSPQELASCYVSTMTVG